MIFAYVWAWAPRCALSPTNISTNTTSLSWMTNEFCGVVASGTPIGRIPNRMWVRQ